jgi:methylenetetrahydrofolate reductase (NADPH)
MAELAAGARIPAGLLRQVQGHANQPAEIEKIGVAWATEQCRGLLEAGVRGIHFYTLNRSKATLEIYANLSPELARVRASAAPRP